MAKAQPKIAVVATKIFDLLTPLASDDRRKVLASALALLGETLPSPPGNAGTGDHGGDQNLGDFVPRVKNWLKQNQLTVAQINEAFHLENGTAKFIGEAQGKNAKEQTLNAYILAGLAAFLGTGEAKFYEKSAVALCKDLGCHNTANHAAYLKGHGKEFTGSKTQGWTLTAPGLRRAAELVKTVASPGE
jgi:hypothetical protein